MAATQGSSKTWKKRDSKERRYVCSECDRGFSTKQILERHMRRHTDNRPFKCNLCEKAYTVKVSLDAHLVSHFGEKPFKCDRCDYCTRTKNCLYVHQRTHDGWPTYKCSDCGLVCSSKDKLSIHADRDHRHSLYCCDSCDFITSIKVYYRQHLNEKKLKKGACDAKAFKCDECGFKTPTLRVLKSHRKDMKKTGRCALCTNEKLPRLVCDYCGFTTLRREIMQRHIDRRDKVTKKCPRTWWRDVKVSSLKWLLRADRREIVVKDKLPPTDDTEVEEDPADEGPLSNDGSLPSGAMLGADGHNDGEGELKEEL
ncbi:zinc finger protein Xfin-like protein [Aphelenchoides avenae]|nr:zinc finger protein Xfin-like protein [Aphelenchus avenae]